MLDAAAAVDVARGLDDTALLGKAHAAFAELILAGTPSLPAAAVEHSEQAQACAQAGSEQLALGATYGSLGLAAMRAGDYESAREMYTQQLMVSLEIGHPDGFMASLANVRLQTGAPAGLGRLADARHDDAGLTTRLRILAVRTACWLELGHLDQAWLAAQALHDLCKRTGAWWVRVPPAAWRLMLVERLGLDQPLDVDRTTLARATAHGRDADRLVALTALARSALAAGGWDEAAQYAEPGLALARTTQAAAHPGDALYTWVGDDGRDQETLTIGNTLALAEGVAARPTGKLGLVPGGRVLLVYPPSLDFVVSFLGCLLAGVVPAPVYPPNPLRLERDLETFAAISADCRAAAILTNAEYSRMRQLGVVKNLFTHNAARWPDLPWRHTVAGTRGQHAAPSHVSRPANLAVLQYTSGLAEHTVSVTVGGRLRLDVDRAVLESGRADPRQDDAPFLTLVGCGRVTKPGAVVRIVAPDTGLPCGEGEIAEIWVDSPTKTAGYFGQEAATREVFGGRLADSSDQRTDLRTGDLGFFWDGELVPSGRCKDPIIIQDRNHYPQDVEDEPLAVDFDRALLPPSRGERSKTVTRWPARDSSRAAVRPDTPAPITQIDKGDEGARIRDLDRQACAS